MAQTKAKQQQATKVVEPVVNEPEVLEVVPTIEQPVEVKEEPKPVEEDPRAEAFYYNHNTFSEARNTFDVIVKLKSGWTETSKRDLYLAEAREAAYEINRELGIDRVERIYNL